MPAGVAADVEDRVDQQIQAQAEPVQLHRQRIDDERHVVADELDCGVRRLPAVLFEVGVVHADSRGTGFAAARECRCERTAP